MTAQCTFRQVCESVFPCVDNLISELDIQNGSNTSFLRPLTNVIDSPCHGNDVKGDGERLTLYSYAHSQNGIMPYLNCGLEGASYRTASNAVKQKSWVHQILQQFRDKGSIRTFQFDNDGMLTITK